MTPKGLIRCKTTNQQKTTIYIYIYIYIYILEDNDFENLQGIMSAYS